MESSPTLSSATSQNRGTGPGGAPFTPVVFSHKLATKLDHDNYLLWRPQVLSAIRGHKLQHYISEKFTPPPQFLSEQDRITENFNPAFLDWDQQDQLLYSWLLSSMTEPVLTRVISCETSARLWSVLSTYFASQTEAKIDQFTTELQNLKKCAHTLNEYLLKVRFLIDKLNSVGHKTSPKEHIAAIFRGLPSPDYDTFVISVNSRAEPLDVTALEALLLAQEHRIERKNRDLDSASVNIANSNF
uniref:Retrotransposon Copia-like N-terminal domain-containing protein n=1 Tax=Cannabis sativa TaxID=3483 RepID=A0A803QST8_CANSA